MSRRERLALPLMAVLLIAGVPAPASAQDAPRAERPEVERLEAELRQLLARMGPVSDRATLERVTRDSLRAKRAQEAATIDTVSVGPLRIVTVAERADEARRAFAAVWYDLEPQIAGAVDMSKATFVYDATDELRYLRFQETSYRVDGRRWTGDWRVRFDDDLLVERIRHSLFSEVSRQLPDGLQTWLRNWPVTPAPERSMGDLYRALVLNGTRATEACVEGDLESCWSSLGFVGDAARLADWVPDAPGALGTCSHDVDALSTLLAETGFLWGTKWSGWGECIPLSREYRGDFVGFALARGGEGSLRRLLAEWPDEVPVAYGDSQPGTVQGEVLLDPTTNVVTFGTDVRARLSHAAGMSEHELVAAWRDRMMDARPDVRVDEDRDRTASFIWVVFFAAFAMRSTRWRLG
ncbi:MAG TPA: hypothetical protein VGA70_11915 [Longimicrobiales bacterium]|jgi:hypothetical protein